MQNLDDLEKMQGQKTPTQQPIRMQQLPSMPQIPSQQTRPAQPQVQQQKPQGQVPPQNLQHVKRKKRSLTKFDKFVIIAMGVILFITGIVGIVLITMDNIKTKRQIQDGYDKALNSPKVQEYRHRQARKQRELAKQRRLKQLGIDGISEPTQKNDLLNEKLREQEFAQKQEQDNLYKEQLGPDYTKELAAYNAKLKEVKAEEARLAAEARARAEAKAKSDAEIKARLGIKE